MSVSNLRKRDWSSEMPTHIPVIKCLWAPQELARGNWWGGAYRYSHHQYAPWERECERRGAPRHLRHQWPWNYCGHLKKGSKCPQTFPSMTVGTSKKEAREEVPQDISIINNHHMSEHFRREERNEVPAENRIIIKCMGRLQEKAKRQWML